MSSSSGDEFEDEAAGVQSERVRAAVHFTVGLICDELSTGPPRRAFSRRAVAALAETAHAKLGRLASDAELFARHAKRSRVAADDIKLCGRKSETLTRELASFIAKMENSAADERAAKKRKKAAKESTEAAAPAQDVVQVHDEDEDNDDV